MKIISINEQCTALACRKMRVQAFHYKTANQMKQQFLLCSDCNKNKNKIFNTSLTFNSMTLRYKKLQLQGI